MKRKFELIFGLALLALMGCLVWAILSGTPQGQKNASPAFDNAALASAAAANATAPAAPARPPLIAPRESLNFGLDEVPVLRRPILGQPLWQFLAALIYIILTFYVSKLLDYIINARLKKWAAQTESKWDDLLLESLHGPVKVVAFVVLLHFGLQLSNFLSKGLQVMVALSLSFLALRCVDLLMIYWRDRLAGDSPDKSIDEMLLPVVSKSLKAFLVVIAVLMTCENLGLDIKAVLATLSVGSLALGLAAQDTLGNMFGAVAILMDKPFKIGDFIKIDSFEGEVESIGLRSTRIRNPDGFLITIPNKTMGNATITNVSRRPTIKSQFMVGLTYDTSTEKLKRALAILEETYKAHPNTHDVWIAFKEFADSSLNVQVIHWSKAKNFKDNLATLQELNLVLKKRFDEEGLAFAFPSRTLYIKQESTDGAIQNDGNGNGNGSRTISVPADRTQHADGGR